jgi:hypothetical protein
MKQVTLSNIAGPRLIEQGARGYTGREQFPALIGRSLTGETSLIMGDACFLRASSVLRACFVPGAIPQSVGPIGLRECVEEAGFGDPALHLNSTSKGGS